MLFPEGKGMINNRIRELEKEELLPSILVSLLDHVKYFGNVSMHEEDVDPSKSDCEAAREFTRLFLTYTFTLPAKVEKLQQSLGSEDSQKD